MVCIYCGQYMGEKDAYCCKCGKISSVVKEQNKGKIFIRLDKVIPTGIIITLIGACLLLLFIFVFSGDFVVLGLAVAISVIGVTIIVKFKEAIKFARSNSIVNGDNISVQKCKYCFSLLSADGQYCTLCGSKYKTNVKQ